MVLEPKQWMTRIYNNDIINLLEIPCFGRGKDANSCIKQLLERESGGFLWMDKDVPIDVDIILQITGILIYGVKPEQYLDNKMKENDIAEEVKAQFDIDRENRGMIIKNNNHLATRFMTNLMECKLLRKCRKEEAPTRAVAVVAQCAKGTVLSWAPYLLNLFLEDCRDAHDSGT
jgi:hypothetical protein